MNAPTLTPTPAHALYAPSSAHRWMHCTASALAISRLGEQEESEEAAKGTRAHDEIERILGGLSGRGFTDGVLFEAYTKPVDANHPSAYGVALVVSFVGQLPAGSLWIEQRVRLTDDIWGRCDVGHWHDESATLTIIDYKDGFVPVEAEKNEQLRIYAAASIFTHQLPARWIRYVVVQPNDFRPVPRVKQWIEPAESLREFAERAAGVPTGPLTFTAGEHCRYCPLFGRCEASRDVLTNLGTMIAHPADQVPAGQVALFMAARKPIEDWFKSADKAWTKRALAGQVPPGMKVVTGQKHRAWRDPNEARRTVFHEKGLEALEPPTPAQAEKMGIDKAWIDAEAPRPEGGPVLAFESDTRPVFERRGVVEMFKAALADVGRTT